MRYRIWGTLMMCLATLVVSMREEAAGATIAYWRFENGAFLDDTSGNGYTLTNYLGAATQSADTPGVISDRSASLPGVSDQAFYLFGMDLSPYTQLTVEFFYKSNGNFANDANVFFEHSGNYNANPGAIGTFGSNNGTSNVIDGDYRADSLGVNNDTVSGAPVNGWHHFAVEYDRTAAIDSEVTKLFLDYVQVGADSLTSAGRDPFLDGTFAFHIGSRAGVQFFYSGLIDEFRISSGLLTPDEFISIPEPTSITMVGLGALGLFVRRRPRHN